MKFIFTFASMIPLLSFDAEKSGSQVRCFRSTATEINNHYFAVERRKDGNPYDMEVEIAVYNGIGQIVSKHSEKIDKGHTTINIDISFYSNGIYLFRVITPDGTHLSKEFIKR